MEMSFTFRLVGNGCCRIESGVLLLNREQAVRNNVCAKGIVIVQ